MKSLLVVLWFVILTECARRKVYFEEAHMTAAKQYFLERSEDWEIVEASKCGCSPYESDFLYARRIDYKKLRKGRHMINRIENHYNVDSKTRLLYNLWNYDKEKRFEGYDSSKFTPQTFAIHTSNLNREKELLNQYFSAQKLDGIWILKPSDASCGEGIEIIYDIKEFQSNFLNKSHLSGDYVIQKYIEKPLLINGKKFDIRCYAMLVSTDPYILIFKHGYVRKTLENYNIEIDDKYVHLVNHEIQKNHPDYERLNNEVHWSMSQLEEYLRAESVGLTDSDIQNIYSNIKKSITYSFLAAQKKFYKSAGVFQLFGVDIMIDSDHRVYLIEINTRPFLKLATPVHKLVVPDLVKNFLDTSIYLFDNRNTIQQLAQNHENILQFCDTQCSLLLNSVTSYNFISQSHPKHPHKPSEEL